MRVRSVFLALVTLGFVGCTGSDAESPGSAGQVRTPADLLLPAHLDCFLAVVQATGAAQIPEFTPPDDDEALDHTLPAADLVAEFRGQFRRLFDVERQGRIWSRDEAWSAACERNDISPRDFAALVQSVSCAIMRVRLESRVEMSRLVENAQAEVDDLVATMNAIDAVPKDERTRQDTFIRSQSALRLARAVALLEFSEMVRRVPAANGALVRKHSASLKPLLPPHGSEELLNELQVLGAAREAPVKTAGHTSGADR